MTLADYRETIDPNSPEIVLLSPPGSPNPYFAEYGWVAGDGAASVPGPETAVDTPRARELTDKDAVTLSWDNGQGLSLRQAGRARPATTCSPSSASVTNNTDKPVTLYPYGLISRWGTPPTLGYYILHEGPIGALGGHLEEWKYKKIAEEGSVEFDSTGGWLGITDKYWLASLVPPAGPAAQGGLPPPGRGRPLPGRLSRRRASPWRPGQTVEVTDRLFAGAKVVTLLDQYRDAATASRCSTARSTSAGSTS